MGRLFRARDYTLGHSHPSNSWSPARTSAKLNPSHGEKAPHKWDPRNFEGCICWIYHFDLSFCLYLNTVSCSNSQNCQIIPSLWAPESQGSSHPKLLETVFAPAAWPAALLERPQGEVDAKRSWNPG